MSFDIANVAGFESAAGDRLPNHLFLGRAAGDGEAARRAILVDSGASDNRQHSVAITKGIREAFEYYHPAALSTDIPVGGGVECLAATVTRQHPGFRKIYGWFGSEDIANSRRQRHGDFPVSQALAGEMNPDERRRAGCINGHAWTGQPKQIRQASRRYTVSSAAYLVGIDGVSILQTSPDQGVVKGADPDKDSGRTPEQLLHHLVGMFERFPAYFK